MSSVWTAHIERGEEKSQLYCYSDIIVVRRQRWERREEKQNRRERTETNMTGSDKLKPEYFINWRHNPILGMHSFVAPLTATTPHSEKNELTNKSPCNLQITYQYPTKDLFLQLEKWIPAFFLIWQPFPLQKNFNEWSCLSSVPFFYSVYSQEPGL